jgi:hypothetical protein
MKNSRDLALIIVFAVLNFTIMLITAEITNLIYMIGLSYVFTVLYAINASVAWLMYEGRRWRILSQAILFNTLAVLFVPSKTVVSFISAISHALVADLIFNSFYGNFKSRDKLLWWIILLQIFFWATSPLWNLVFLSSFVYPLESVLKVFFIPTMTVGFPIMMVSAIAGAIIGYKIFRRVENIR